MKKRLEDIIMWVAENGVFRVGSLILTTFILCWDWFTMGFRGFMEWDLGIMAQLGLFVCIGLLWIDFVVDRYLGV